MIDWTEPFSLASPAGALVLGAVTSESWFDSGCGAGPRARWLSNGAIEIEGEGVIKEALPQPVLQWGDFIAEAAQKHAVPPQWIAGEMAAESGGQQRVHSWCCYGLMGLLPATASSMAGRKVGADELLDDPELNIDLGTKLLGQLFVKYGGNPIKVPAAYNAGSAKCGAGKCETPNRWNLVADCVKGKAIDYSTRVIRFSNAALGSGIDFAGSKTLFGSTSYLKVGLGVAFVLGIGYVACPSCFPSWHSIARSFAR